MSIRNLSINNSYTGKGTKILKDFVIPVLSVTENYDRITSFYNMESLLAISQGIQGIYERGGKMRLIAGIHSVPKEIIDATLQEKYLQEEIARIGSEIEKGITSLTDALEKERLATLAWMIEDGLLEIKVASVKGDDGIFHPKTLIFSDAEGNRVVAVGSSNETRSGLGGNFEQLMVAKSWVAEDAVIDQEAFFDSLWDNKNEDAIVFEITEDTASVILTALDDEYRNRKKHASTSAASTFYDMSQMPSNYFVSGEIPSLYMHQERAVLDALSRWPVRVLFADEVGLGKTFETAATMKFLTKYCGIKRVLILTPKAVLSQWQTELYDFFHINAWLFDSSNKTFYDAEENIISMGKKSPLGKGSPDIMLMSAQYARGQSGRKNIFELEGTIIPDLLIIDEAHSARVSSSFSGKRKKTLMYRMLEAVSPKIPHIILATATPMQKDPEEYHALLKLLGLPGLWGKTTRYMDSLRILTSDVEPDATDAFLVGKLIQAVIQKMKPENTYFSTKEKDILTGLLNTLKGDASDVSMFVQNNWNKVKPVFVKAHPANMLTVRNTRKSLEDVGYVFPKRNLLEEAVKNSSKIQLFYTQVNDYISNHCFLVEQELKPESTVSVGLVKSSYQQRMASSLHSCKESLNRRLIKLEDIKANYTKSSVKKVDLRFDTDDIDDDELFLLGADNDGASDTKVDIDSLMRALDIEITDITSLMSALKGILEDSGDLKIKKAIDVCLACVSKGDKVLVFSRYTDTVDALIKEFTDTVDDKFRYGIYTGNRSEIIKGEEREECSKSRIKQELFYGDLKVMFCSDAASEGLNLQAARVLINVDVPWTPSRLEQRIGRVARLGQRAKEVDIYNIWYPNSIEARMYNRIKNRHTLLNLAVGEFPEVVASEIQKIVLEDRERDDSDLKELQEIRNSIQARALEMLWLTKGVEVTNSMQMRKNLINICCASGIPYDENKETNIYEFRLPNGNVELLTSTDGLEESISLSCELLKSINRRIDNIQTLKDGQGVPAAISYNGSKAHWIENEDILKLLNGIQCDEKDFELEPKMLAKLSNINMSFAYDGTVDEPPILWPPTEENEIVV